jgi:hypothetical protein
MAGGSQFDRMVGSIPLVLPGIYLGTVTVPSYTGNLPANGFFRIRTPCQ